MGAPWTDRPMVTVRKVDRVAKASVTIRGNVVNRTSGGGQRIRGNCGRSRGLKPAALKLGRVARCFERMATYAVASTPAARAIREPSRDEREVLLRTCAALSSKV